MLRMRLQLGNLVRVKSRIFITIPNNQWHVEKPFAGTIIAMQH